MFVDLCLQEALSLSRALTKAASLPEKIECQLFFLSFEFLKMTFPLWRNDFHLIEAGTNHCLNRIAYIDYFAQLAHLPLYL